MMSRSCFFCYFI